MTTPRTLLLQVDNTARAATRIRIARALADAFDAHVIAQPCWLPGMLRYPLASEGASAAASLMQAYDEDCLARAHATFRRETGGDHRLRWVEPLPSGPSGFAPRTLDADLVVLGQHDPADPAAGDLPPDFVADVVVRSGQPTLVLPFAGTVDPLGGTVLVAWKPTREAGHALAAALPWMHRAHRVHLLSCMPEAGAALHRLERRLAAHGIRVDTHDGGAEPDDLGNLLLSRAADLGADLLVMGAYGHSRAREWVLGGATRTLLRSMTLPVLMAH